MGRHQSPSSGPATTRSRIRSQPARPSSVTTTDARISAIVPYGRRSGRMPGISPGRSGASRGRERRGAFGVPPRSSFGARLRSRVPQYGHSVMYGDTSEPQLLQTTKRSGPLAMGIQGYAPPDVMADAGSYWLRTHANSRRTGPMALGYDGKLYILAFDHRGSFQKKMFGIEGDPTPEETERIADAKRVIFEGMELAVERGVDPQATGVLVDEQFGSDIPKRAKQENLVLSMPVEKSGQDEFDFQYGEDFGEHISSFGVDFAKVLVRYNADDDAGMNERQLGRLKRLADWLHENDIKFLFELLVPAEPDQLESVDGDSDRYDAELRPELMRRAIENCQNLGIEVDIWKIE